MHKKEQNRQIGQSHFGDLDLSVCACFEIFNLNPGKELGREEDN